MRISTNVRTEMIKLRQLLLFAILVFFVSGNSSSQELPQKNSEEYRLKEWRITKFREFEVAIAYDRIQGGRLLGTRSLYVLIESRYFSVENLRSVFVGLAAEH